MMMTTMTNRMIIVNKLKLVRIVGRGNEVILAAAVTHQPLWSHSAGTGKAGRHQRAYSRSGNKEREERKREERKRREERRKRKEEEEGERGREKEKKKKMKIRVVH
uniref:Uncharacterized protein n=1 Tax=Cacopsylla melanoneura TaxID=428564 RepID=A0A8D8WJE9_9HEMI